jgi:hypothetical protein
VKPWCREQVKRMVGVSLQDKCFVLPRFACGFCRYLPENPLKNHVTWLKTAREHRHLVCRVPAALYAVVVAVTHQVLLCETQQWGHMLTHALGFNPWQALWGTWLWVCLHGPFWFVEQVKGVTAQSKVPVCVGEAWVKPLEHMLR